MRSMLMQFQCYFVAVFAVISGAAVRVVLLGDLGSRLPFVTFLPFVLIVILFFDFKSRISSAS